MRLTHSIAILACLMSGCALSAADKPEPPALSFVANDQPSDGFTRRLELRGAIEFGVPIEAAYANEGSYAGYLFTAAAESDVTISVAGNDNDAVLYMYGPIDSESGVDYPPFASNDDGGPAADSFLARRIPTDGTYLLLVHEFLRRPGNFTISLDCGGVDCHPACRSHDMCGPQAHCLELRSYCVPTVPEFCDVEFCGEPPSDRIVCEDGSFGGNTGRCLLLDDETCGWEMRECPGPLPCGAHLGNTCESGEFCDFDEAAMCGSGEATGHCAKLPAACTSELLWVCGCNGRNYQNACKANAAGIAVQHDGICGSRGVACGESLGDTCGANEFCNFSEELTCGWGGENGLCASIPETCTSEVSHVCGCDGVTYQNRCIANATGRSIFHDGVCAPPPPPSEE